MTIQAVIVAALLLAIIVPVVMSERARRPVRRAAPKRPPGKPQTAAAPKPALRLLVNKNDMDRELAALLAKDSRKSTDEE